MDFLEKIAARFLIWRLKKGYGDQCNSIEDWIDGEILHESGCRACKIAFARRVLRDHVDLLS